MASARYTLNIDPEDLKPDEPIEYTKKQKAANWWHYNWKIVAVVAVLVVIAGHYVWKAITTVHPDEQIALVSAQPLPTELQTALEQALGGVMEDSNGDGQVLAQIRSYQVSLEQPDTSGSAAQDVGDAMTDMTNGYMQMAQSTVLTADLASGDAYIFLVDEPEAFQNAYGVLAREDGSMPDEDNLLDGVEWYNWSDCPVLASLDLGEYTTMAGEVVTGQEYMSRFVVGHRSNAGDEEGNLDAADALFDTLTAGATAR